MNREDQLARERDEQSTRGRANLLGVPYLDSRRLTDFQPVPDVISVADMKERRLIPLVKSSSQIDFAITINSSQQLLSQLKQQFADYNLKLFIISDTGFKDLMRIYDPPVVVRHDDIEIKSEGSSETIFDVSQSLDSVSSDEIMAYLVLQAVRLNVSDIHMEAMRTHVRMRFRIDGVLHPVAVMTHAKYRQIQSSIAIKAGIASAAPEPQTGHMNETITIDDAQQLVNMRIETAPTSYGQDAVIRLFTKNQDLLDLEKLGLAQRQREEIDRIVNHPHGMMLIVGPTGSGKTTTLYSVISRLNQPTRKIVTLEDPIEYNFEGISQIQVESRFGKSFDETLRSVLRQDPDVIMVGEIRDADTAKTALQASLTGHLVLSTFHADTAAAALTRMFDSIGGNPMFSSAIKLVIAQRLVRRLDDETKAPYAPDEQVKQHIRDVLKDLPESIERPNLDDFQLYRPGDSETNPIGYKGRIIVMEQLVMNDSIQAIVHDDTRRSQEAVTKQAKANGMVTLLQDAMLKVLSGETTIEEVYKVID